MKATIRREPGEVVFSINVEIKAEEFFDVFRRAGGDQESARKILNAEVLYDIGVEILRAAEDMGLSRAERDR